MQNATTEAEWAERVAAWRESGQTATAFAEGKGFTGKQLGWWKGELGRRQQGVRLARVVPVKGARALLTVCVGRARVEVSTGFDRMLLREVVDALGADR